MVRRKRSREKRLAVAGGPDGSPATVALHPGGLGAPTDPRLPTVVAHRGGDPTSASPAPASPSAPPSPPSPSGPARIEVPSGVIRVEDVAQASDLARRLLTPGRRWPVAVVTVASGESEPYADVDALATDLRGLVEVVVMPTAQVTWAFSGEMPPLTQVYGGASRVYPITHEWVSNPRRSRLHFAYSPRDRDRVTEHLIADGMAAAVAAGLLEGRRPAGRQPATGVVKAVIGSRAIVQLDDGSMATLWEELSGFDVPLECLVRPRQRIGGLVDVETRRLDLAGTPSLPSGEAGLPPEYRPGSVVLVQVREVSEAGLVVRLTPGVSARIDHAAVSTNENDRLDSLFSAGEVVVARLTGVAPVALSMLDVDDDESPLPPPALLPGGPPWLVLPERPSVLAEREEPPHPVPSPGPGTGAGGVTAQVREGAVPVRAPASPGEAPGRRPVPLPSALAPARVPPPGVPAPAVGPGTPPAVPPGIPPAPAPHVPPAIPAPPAVTPKLVPGRRSAAPGGTVPTVAPSLEATDLRRRLDAARAENARLERELAQLRGAEQELAHVRDYAADLERQLRTSEANRLAFRTKYRDADRNRQQLERRAAEAGVETALEETRLWFADPEEALRCGVTIAWAHRVAAVDKPRWPLREWSIGPAFVASLADLGPVSWRRLCEMVCDVVVGDPARLSALGDHELRRGSGGNAGAVTREDGAVCYRVALQRGAPSARRLHYWRRSGTRGPAVELSRVVVHDDTAP